MRVYKSGHWSDSNFLNWTNDVHRCVPLYPCPPSPSGLPPQRLQAAVPPTAPGQGPRRQPVPRGPLPDGGGRRRGRLRPRRLHPQAQELRELLAPPHQALLLPLVGEVQERRCRQRRSRGARELIATATGITATQGHFIRLDRRRRTWVLARTSSSTSVSCAVADGTLSTMTSFMTSQTGGRCAPGGRCFTCRSLQRLPWEGLGEKHLHFRATWEQS